LLVACGPPPSRDADVSLYQSGLPLGAAASVVYDGAASGTFTTSPTRLPMGNYTFAAASVSDGGRTYLADPAERLVTVSGPTVVAFAFVPQAAASETIDLTEVVAPGNEQNGIVFDLRASQDVLLHGFDLHGNGDSGLTVRVYVRDGTAIGMASDVSGWTLHDEATDVTLPMHPATATIPVRPLRLAAGATYGVVVTLSEATQFLRYDNGDTATVGDGVLDLTHYAGRSLDGRVFVGRLFRGRINYSAPAPADLSFAGRLVLSGPAGEITGDTTGGTPEVSEPTHCGVGVGASSWWRWTAPSAGNVTFTADAGRPSVVAAYTGSALAALTEIGCAADATRPELTFAAAQGVPYVIAVDGSTPATGPFSLSWTY
jgi:hypothetical protein